MVLKSCTNLAKRQTARGRLAGSGHPRSDLIVGRDDSLRLRNPARPKGSGKVAAWGHDGGYPGGFKTYAYTSPNGSRQAVMVYNDFRKSLPRSSGGTSTPAFVRDVKKATEIAFCGQR